jgi:hypothetical protein
MKGVMEWRWIGAAVDWRCAGLEALKIAWGVASHERKICALGFSSNGRWFISVECASTVLETGNVGEVTG